VLRHIMSAFDDSRQATRAFEVAVDLAKQLRTELYLITVSEPLPSYTASIDVEMPGGRRVLLNERSAYYRELQGSAMTQLSAAGLDVRGLVIEGAEVQATIDRIAE
jgi:nucleotide-binding universal stress UspA family protein